MKLRIKLTDHYQSGIHIFNEKYEFSKIEDASEYMYLYITFLEMASGKLKYFKRSPQTIRYGYGTFARRMKLVGEVI